MSKFIEIFDDHHGKKQIGEVVSIHENRTSNSSDETVRAVVENEQATQINLEKQVSKSSLNEDSFHSFDDQISTVHFIGIVIAVVLSLFIFALDQCVMATTLPAVADHFDALDQMVWLVNAIFLTLIGFSMAYIQCCQFVPAKHSTMFAIFCFEVGILISSLASNFEMLLAGRIISGLGGAGLYNGGMLIVTETFSLKKRVKVFGFMATSFGIAAMIGPAIAGTLTQKLSWRWCFWINLPFGGISLIMIAFLTKARPPLGFEELFTGYNLTMLDNLLRCDWIGVGFILAWGSTVIVSMADGGRSVRWNNAIEIFLLVMVGVLPILFGFWEWYMDKQALIQISIFKQKNMRSALLVGLCTFASSSGLLFFLSAMLQALYNIKGTIGGLLILPLIIGQTLALVLAGEIVIRTRLAWPLLVIGPILTTISGFLLSTIQQKTSLVLIIMLSCLAGIGTGLVSQTVMLIAQIHYKKNSNLIGSATGLTLLFNNLGRFVGVAIGSCIFGNTIKHNLFIQAPKLDQSLRFLVQHNAQAIWSNKISMEFRPLILQAYRLSLDDVFIAAACFGGLGILCSFLADWTRV